MHVQSDVQMPSHGIGRLRVALLYSGRFFGAQISAGLIDNHLENIIKPNAAAVFVAVDPTTWCAAPLAARRAYGLGDRWTAETYLQEQVRSAFRNWHQLHVALISSEDPAIPHLYGKAGINAMNKLNATGHRAAIFIHKWYMQFDHYAKADALRQAYGPHDLVVRVRMDVEIERPLLLERGRGERFSGDAYSVYVRAVNGSKVLVQKVHTSGSARMSLDGDNDLVHEEVGSFGSPAIYTDDKKGPTSVRQCVPYDADPSLYSMHTGHPACSNASADEKGELPWMWSDWLFIGSASALAPLAAMTSRGFVLASSAVRCYGLCQEEQTTLQLQHAGVTLKRLRLPLRIHKINTNPCGATPLLNLTQLASQHQISSWYAPCPPMERGCSAKTQTAERDGTDRD